MKVSEKNKKLSKKNDELNKQMTCHNCVALGHDIRTCPNAKGKTTVSKEVPYQNLQPFKIKL